MNSKGSQTLGFRAATSVTCHLFSHWEQQLAVAVIHLLQEPSKLLQLSCSLAGTSPAIVIRTTFGETGYFGRLLSFVEELVERNFQCMAYFPNVSMVRTVWPFSTRDV